MHVVPRDLSDEARAAVAQLSALEPLFVACGRRAAALQGRVSVEQKAHTGDHRTDVVTEADRDVQAHLLAGLVETPLTRCRLLAEETPVAGEADLRHRFSEDGELFLTLDPIDGTSRFVANQPYFSTIIGLHDARRPLYTFMYYPVFDWWVRVADISLEMSGPPPVDPTEGGQVDLSRVLVYTAGDPERSAPSVTAWLREQGAEIRFGESIGACGSKYLYLSGAAGGYFGCAPNPYDGLFALHCAMARGSVVLAEGEAPGTPLDLSRLAASPRGLFHPGWYAVLPPALSAPL